MDLPTGILALGTIIIIAAFIAQPFLSGQRNESSGRGSSQSATKLRSRAELLAARNRVYATLRDLDFDYKTNKIADDEYAEQRHALVAEGVGILQQLDALPEFRSIAEEDPIEAIIADARGGQPVDVTEIREAQGGRFCPQCGEPARKGDKFCGSCGAEIKE